MVEHLVSSLLPSKPDITFPSFRTRRGKRKFHPADQNHPREKAVEIFQLSDGHEIPCYFSTYAEVLIPYIRRALFMQSVQER